MTVVILHTSKSKSLIAVGPTPGLHDSRPGVRRTPGITAVAAAPGAAFTVMPRVGPTSPRARATVHLTKALRFAE